MSSWDVRLLGLTAHVAAWSKDPSTKCGAVICDDQHVIVSVGYNGFPRRVPDEKHLLENRDEKYLRVVHAEANAILFAARPIANCTIYTWPFGPCARCATLIIQANIMRVVFPYIERTSELYRRWELEYIAAGQMFRHAGLEIEELKDL